MGAQVCPSKNDVRDYDYAKEELKISAGDAEEKRSLLLWEGSKLSGWRTGPAPRAAAPVLNLAKRALCSPHVSTSTKKRIITSPLA